jgi:hypothetical protein
VKEHIMSLSTNTGPRDRANRQTEIVWEWLHNPVYRQVLDRVHNGPGGDVDYVREEVLLYLFPIDRPETVHHRLEQCALQGVDWERLYHRLHSSN